MIKSFKMISQKISDKKHDKIKAIKPKKTKQTKPQHNMVVIHWIHDKWYISHSTLWVN